MPLQRNCQHALKLSHLKSLHWEGIEHCITHWRTMQTTAKLALQPFTQQTLKKLMANEPHSTTKEFTLKQAMSFTDMTACVKTFTATVINWR